MANYRLAQALVNLRAHINEDAPTRNKASDGWIGDAAHAARSSDHNPWIKDPDGSTVVSAIDITHDPEHGVDGQRLRDQLVGTKDPRIKYVIWNRTITSGKDGPGPWVSRPYKGSNPHNHHVHISVEDTKRFYDDNSVWQINLGVTKEHINAPLKETHPTTRLLQQGDNVKLLQQLLIRHGYEMQVDGSFGHKTLRAVIDFQRAHGLSPDGVVGSYTWEILEK